MSSLGRAIADTARGFVGTPFRHQGRQPHKGLDCAGLALCAAWDCGVQVPDFDGYGRLPQGAALLEQLALRCRQVEASEEQPGDLLLFSWRRNEPAHFAVADDGCIVHAYEQAGGTIIQQLSRAWRSRLHSRWRFLGVG